MSQQVLVDFIVENLENSIDRVFENVLSDPNATQGDFDALFKLGGMLARRGLDISDRARMEEYNAQDIGGSLESLEIDHEETHAE